MNANVQLIDHPHPTFHPHICLGRLALRNDSMAVGAADRVKQLAIFYGRMFSPPRAEWRGRAGRGRGSSDIFFAGRQEVGPLPTSGVLGFSDFSAPSVRSRDSKRAAITVYICAACFERKRFDDNPSSDVAVGGESGSDVRRKSEVQVVVECRPVPTLFTEPSAFRMSSILDAVTAREPFHHSTSGP